MLWGCGFESSIECLADLHDCNCFPASSKQAGANVARHHDLLRHVAVSLTCV